MYEFVPANADGWYTIRDFITGILLYYNFDDNWKFE